MRMHARKSFGGLRRIGVLSSVLACGHLLVTAVRADIVVPNQYATTEAGGTSANFMLADSYSRPLGYHGQLFIDQSQLSGLVVGTQITGIGLRLDRDAYVGVGNALPGQDLVYSQYNVTLSQAATTVSTMSTTFADNLLNPVVVRNGPLTIPKETFNIQNNFITSSSDALPFHEVIEFSTPYTYLGGDLVVDIAYLPSSGGDGSWPAVDGTPNTNSSLPYRFLRNLNGMSQAVATQERGAPIVQFVTVPAPTCAVILGMGGLVSCRRRRCVRNSFVK